jgi:hypothetical protein
MKVDSGAFVVKSNESDLHEQAKDIEMLRAELSELERMIFKVNMNGMCALLYICSRVKSVDYRSLQYDILSVKMLMRVSSGVYIS